MSEFSVLIQSLGEHAVDYIKNAGAGLESLYIFGDETTATARIVVDLEQDTWDTRRAALQRYVELQEIFKGEISLSITFSDPEAEALYDEMEAADDQSAPHQRYAFA